MFKKIATYTVYTLLTLVPLLYLFFSARLTARESSELVCERIVVRVLDSAQNRFVEKSEIVNIIVNEGITLSESRIKNINLHQLEELINNRTAVKISQISITRRGTLRADITQRRPIIRLETLNGGFYMDDSGYLFPLLNNYSSYVPVITGNIPVNIPRGFRGDADKEERWFEMVYNLGIYLENNSFWNSMIEQIHINRKGVMLMTPRIGETEIIFGTPDNIDLKFRKLNAFYSVVVPSEGWEKYSSVDVRFSNQLVCKKKNN